MADFETKYVFCKDNRLLLIGECLFAKASTANASLSSWSSNSSVASKQHIQIQSVLAHTLKVAILTSYKKLSVGYIELKLHIQTLGISETYFTSCKKEHNRSPLIHYIFIWHLFLLLLLFYSHTDRWSKKLPKLFSPTNKQIWACSIALNTAVRLSKPQHIGSLNPSNNFYGTSAQPWKPLTFKISLDRYLPLTINLP